jgi:hypothetical protein
VSEESSSTDAMLRTESRFWSHVEDTSRDNRKLSKSTQINMPDLGKLQR